MRRKSKPENCKYDYNQILAYFDLQERYRTIKIKHIKKYGKRTFMYSQDGKYWINEYRLEEFA